LGLERPDVARNAAHCFINRTFEGRSVTIRFYPLKMYQRYFHKGLSPKTKDEKIQLALDTEERLMLSNAKLFQGIQLR